MAVLLSPVFQPDAASVDANGVPRSGALLFTYVAGSSTKVTTHKDSAGSVAHTNPIVLNASGLPPAPIWLTTGASVKFVLAPSTDTDPPTSPILTIDNISAINDVAGVAGTEWTSSGMTPTYVSATSFTVPGDQTSVVHVGRRLKLTVTAGTIYATITRSVYTSLTTLTIENDSGSLDSGLSAFSYGTTSADNTSLPFFSRDQQCGRMVYVSTTQIRLDPQDGNTIWVYTGSAWKRRTIPSAGITAANTNIYIDGTSGQNLAASTTYYVYLWDNAGVLAHDFSAATGPAVDATSGLKIKTGVATRLLVAIARTNASSQFELVLSWYRHRAIRHSAAHLSRAHTSTSDIELHSEIRVPFLSWADEAGLTEYTGYGTNGTTGTNNTTKIALDGIATALIGIIVTTPTGAYACNYSFGIPYTFTEGYHYVTIAVNVSSGTGTWSSGNLFVTTQG